MNKFGSLRINWVAGLANGPLIRKFSLVGFRAPSRSQFGDGIDSDTEPNGLGSTVDPGAEFQIWTAILVLGQDSDHDVDLGSGSGVCARNQSLGPNPDSLLKPELDSWHRQTSNRITVIPA